MSLFLNRTMAVLALAGIPMLALAAQDGKVVTQEAAVYESPDSASAVIGTLKHGETARISNESRSGWYRVQLPVSPDSSGHATMGWVRADQIESQRLARELHGAGISLLDNGRRQNDQRQFLLFVYGGVACQNPVGLQNAVGAPDEVIPGPNVGASVGMRLDDFWSVFLDGGYVSARGTSVAGSGGSRPYSSSGELLTVMAQRDFIFSDPWRLGIALGGGVSLGTTVSGTVGGTEAAFDAGSVPAVIGKFVFRYYLSETFSLGLDVGYRYLSKTDFLLNQTILTADLSTAFLTAGLELSF